MTDRKRAALARLMLFTGAILWGSSYFVLKNTLDEVPLFLLLSIRFFFAGLILLAVRAPYLRRLNRRCLGTGALTGLFLALAYIFQTVGLTNTTPGTSAFLTTVYCVLVPFLSFCLFQVLAESCVIDLDLWFCSGWADNYCLAVIQLVDQYVCCRKSCFFRFLVICYFYDGMTCDLCERFVTKSLHQS